MPSIIPYGRQEINDSDIEAVVHALRSDFLTQGPTVEAFEKGIRAVVQAEQCIAVSNGTAALYLTYRGLGLGKGDAVFVPAITFVSTAYPALSCSAKVFFVDVDPVTGLLALESLKNAIALARSSGLRPRVVTVVHLAGRPGLSFDLVEMCQQNGIALIEDACHALGAGYRLTETENFRPVGSCTESAATIFSFHPVKHITTGEGGAITTRSTDLADRLQKLRSHGITKKPDEFTQRDLAFERNGSINPWYYEMQELGFNARLGEIESALGLNQLRRLTPNIEERRSLSQYYRKVFTSHPLISLPPEDSSLTIHAYHLFPLKVNFEKAGKSRATVMRELAQWGVGTQVHYIPLPLQPYFQHSPLVVSPEIPGALAYYKDTLSIPMYPGLNTNGKERVAEAILKVLRT